MAMLRTRMCRVERIGSQRRLIAAFDSEPEIKSRIARALLEIDDERAA